MHSMGAKQAHRAEDMGGEIFTVVIIACIFPLELLILFFFLLFLFLLFFVVDTQLLLLLLELLLLVVEC